MKIGRLGIVSPMTVCIAVLPGGGTMGTGTRPADDCSCCGGCRFQNAAMMAMMAKADAPKREIARAIWWPVGR